MPRHPHIASAHASFSPRSTQPCLPPHRHRLEPNGCKNKLTRFCQCCGVITRGVVVTYRQDRHPHTTGNQEQTELLHDRFHFVHCTFTKEWLETFIKRTQCKLDLHKHHTNPKEATVWKVPAQISSRNDCSTISAHEQLDCTQSKEGRKSTIPCETTANNMVECSQKRARQKRQSPKALSVRPRDKMANGRGHARASVCALEMRFSLINQ